MDRSEYSRIGEDEEAPFFPGRPQSSAGNRFAIAKFAVSTLAVLAGAVGFVALMGSSQNSGTTVLEADNMAHDAAQHWSTRSDVQAMTATKDKRPEKTQPPETLFDDFKTNFGRKYDTRIEEVARFEIFKENLEKFHGLNDKNPLALFGINDFADYTNEEKTSRKMKKWSRKLGSKPMWQNGDLTFELKESNEYLVESDCAACTLFPEAAEWSMEKLPTDFDWRPLGAVTGVKNQGQCGSCWAFSSIADIEGQNFLATGSLQSFSEQELVSCSTENYGCDGGFPLLAMEYAASIGGVVSEDAFPYEAVSYATPYTTGPDGVTVASSCGAAFVETEEAEGVPVGIVGGAKVVSVSGANEEFMALALAKNGPLSLALNAVGMEHYIKGIIGCETIAGAEYCGAGTIDDPDSCDPSDIDHAVALVGYGVDAGTPYWTIKNSWTTGWGEDGYYRLEKGVNKCGVANMVAHSEYGSGS